MSEQKPQGMRFSSGKMKFWSQIPKDALVEIMRVYHIGGIKYDENNWLRGMKFSDMANPLERHWFLWSMGDTKDRETRCHHLAHVAWNAIGLLVYELRGLGIDDRIKLPIDADFSWLSGPAKEMDLGLTKSELDELAVKYNKEKEAHKKATGMKVDAVVPKSSSAQLLITPPLGEIQACFVAALNTQPIASKAHIYETYRLWKEKDQTLANLFTWESFLKGYVQVALEHCQDMQIPLSIELFEQILAETKEPA